MELPVPDEWSIHVPSGGWREIRELGRKESDTFVRSQCAAKHNGQLVVQGVCVCACVRVCVCVCVSGSSYPAPVAGPFADKETSRGTVVSAMMPAQHISNPSRFVQGNAQGLRYHCLQWEVQGSRCVCVRVCVRVCVYLSHPTVQGGTSCLLPLSLVALPQCLPAFNYHEY